MSLKAELETWSAALTAYDEQDFDKALDLFSRIADSSKILTNMGLIYATLGEHEAAVERFMEATQLDQYLAVAYFQCGVSNFLLARYELAHKDFQEAFQYLRGNQAINYEQLGLKFRLFSAEVLFNRGLSLIYMGRVDEGLRDMEDARRDKAIDDHNVIDDAIADRGEGYTVFSIPVGILYRPSDKKLKNAAQKDYMGRAKLVAASDPGDAFIEFTGVTRLKQGVSPANVYIERPSVNDNPPANLSRSATTPSPAPPKLSSETVALGRSKTTLNVPTNARELTAPGGRSGSPPKPVAGPSIGRSNTQITPARASPNASIGGATRGLSIRRPDGNPSPPLQPPRGGDSRVTEIYDDYIDAYNDPPAVPNPTDRVANWARNNANPAAPPTRSASRSAPMSSYAPSSYTGGSMRRRPTRRTTRRDAPSRSQSLYEEDEEGYASGDYDDGPYELVKIRVKLHYNDDVRGMALTPDTSFEEFMDKVTAKFGRAMDGLGLKFKDEDGGKVTLRDESDYELAIETARTSSQGKSEGKLEIWCSDL